jgi:gliding motility-associated-like protein
LTLTTSQTNESCNGGSNATASASASGGSPLYSYTWLTSPTQTGPTATGLTAGTYTVIVNDSRGCNTFQVVTITQPTPVTGFASIISNVSCNGACDGIAYVSGGGGTPGYSYSWSPGGSSVQTLSNLCAGPYFVNVFDTNGCLAQSNVIAISQPQPLTSSASSIDSVNCFGGSDGAIILSTNGGTAPYSYNWSPSGGPGDTASNLVAGCYTALITDQHGCTTSDTLCVQQPTQLLSSVSSQTDVSCNGGNNGIAVVGASGGSPQYTFSWSGSPSTTDTASNLTAGSYTATITDQNGCSTTQAITITEPTALNLQGSSSNSTCTQSNGSAWIVVTGGTGGYTYLWSAGGQQGQTATSLSAAIYTVTVTDANGCTAVDFVQVSDAGGPITNATAISDVSCSGDSTGSAWVSVSSGTPPFTYSWSPTGGNSDTATGLTANTYFITVTDSNGCVSIDTVSITQPPALVSSIGSSGNVICNGQGNGTATVTVNGGSPAYTYSWSNGDTTATISGLSPNIYTVTVTDALGCLTVSTDTITEPATLITVTDSIHNVGCHGESSGNIYTSTSGGTLGYTFSWTPPGLPATPNLIGISAGIYTLLVTDSNGCTSSITDTVTEPAIIVPLITAIQLNGFEIKCNGDSNGVAYVDTVFGGTFPYTYTWSTGSNNDTIYNLHPGQYSIVVYDQNGCSADTFITLTEPLPISLQDTLANVTCSNSCDGFIAIDTVFGGVGSYTYNWSPVSSTLDSIGGLCAGSYTVTVTDLNGCTMQAITDITQPNPIVIGATFSDFNTYNISCNGASDGCIDITALGGTGTLYIIWTPTGDTTFTICGLSADTPYTAHITDDNGCILDTTFILTEPPAVNGSLSSSPNLCNGDSTGTAWATVSGGVTPYTYLWTPTGQTGSTASGLTSGTYTATITDANGCSSIISVSVTQPNALSATTSTTDALCNGGATGTATANASGGVGAYTYSWNTSPVQTIQTAINLPAGCYTVLVTDANGCTTTQVACVTEPTALSATTSTTDVLCNSDTTGTATVNPSGGVSPYTFNWDTSPIQNGQTATGLAQGTYTIVVTDQNGCNYFTTAVVTEPPPVSAIISTTDVLCNGGSTGTASVIASGGVAGYIYLWNPGLQTGTTANGLTVGCYTVTVTDANGCTVTQTACVAEPNAVTVTATSTPAICNGGSTGTATAAASGGVGGYVYVWNTSPPQMSQTATSLSNGTYVVVVTDANNCSSSTSVLVAQPAPITTDAGPYQIICGSSTTLNAQLNVGQNGYWNVQIGSAIFSPDTIVPNAQVSGLQYGGNVLLWSITDANGCTASDTVSILAYEDVQAVAGSPDTTICQAAFTSYELTAANPAAGTGIWSVSGNNGNPNGIADSTALSTQYTSAIAGANIILWTVTNGPCRNQDTVIITIKTDGECLNLELPSGYTPNGDGYNDSYIIHGLEGYPENTFIVFNRWGNEVFKKDNYKNNGYSADWFGQNNQGDPLPDGTYYVILKIKNSSLAKNTYVDLRR